MKLDLNSECKKFLPKVDHVFLFDDDVDSILMSILIKEKIERTTGLKSFGKDMCSQITFYEMPNKNVCAVAYPSSVKVDYDKFDEEIKTLFKHVDYRNFSGNSYAFLLYLERNGYTPKIYSLKI